MRTSISWARLSILVIVLLAGAGCRRESPDGSSKQLEALTPSRGIILISIDTLRADRLGAYGYPLDTSPTFDRLARKGVLFERAIAQYPSTLTSHMSLFTGFYPQEHRVLPPSTVLAESIGTFPERFKAHGFKTAGHTEGGFVSGGYGFRRGFDEFTDTSYRSDTDVERTFERGLTFLRNLESDDRFLLFLHTYSVHDPYAPPDEYRQLFWSEDPPHVFDSSGENLRLFNRGKLELSEEGLAYFEAMYDASVRYVDDVLADFVSELENLGLMSDTVLIVTSDHGEEFREHGRLAHTQIYPECLQVPLLVVHPEVGSGRRIANLVELVDIAPTLYELAGLEVPSGLSGSGLLEQIASSESTVSESQAYAEVLDVEFAYTLWSQKRDHLYQMLMAEPELDPTGPWVRSGVSFDTEESSIRFEAHSFFEPRTVHVRVDGESQPDLALRPEWRSVELELPEGAGVRRVELEADGCRSPADVGEGEDDRCLAFQVRGLRPLRFELYDLIADPDAQHDIYRESRRVGSALRRRLLGLKWEALESGKERELSSEDEETLRALGYLD